jgi:hypothetical protein
LEEISRKYPSTYYEVVRAKFIIIFVENMDNKDIAEHLNLPHQIVSKLRKRFYNERLEGLKDRKRRWRPLDFSH